MPGNIKEIRKGYYKVIVEAGKDPSTGHRKRVVRYVHGREGEAKDLLAALTAELNTGTYIEPSKITVAEWLDTWLKTYKTMDLRQTTMESYQSMIDTHVVPLIGAMPLQALRPEHLQSLYQRKLHDEKKSARTVQYLHRIVNGALKQAWKNKLLPSNINEATTPPRVRRDEAKTLPEENLDAFLVVLEGERLRAAFIALLGTGLRRGEVLGLRWLDIDLEERVLHVRQQVVKVNGGAIIVEPKSQKSRRTVPLGALVVGALTRHQEAMEEKGLYRSDLLVFPSLAGTPIHPRNFHRKYKELLKTAKLPDLRVHDLRHTFATRLLEQGEEMRVIQELLGHSSYNLTANTYSHVSDKLKRRAVDKLDGIFGGTKKAPKKKPGTNRAPKRQNKKPPEPGRP